MVEWAVSVRKSMRPRQAATAIKSAFSEATKGDVPLRLSAAIPSACSTTSFRDAFTLHKGAGCLERPPFCNLNSGLVQGFEFHLSSTKHKAIIPINCTHGAEAGVIV